MGSVILYYYPYKWDDQDKGRYYTRFPNGYRDCNINDTFTDELQFAMKSISGG